ncbi:EPIDERMAL PATTERNING FACTOR-like protein 8 [Raphanus sativus]|uniref:Epidermal patterning factor-like protein n=1 Tax=Raphanus sativus TaxID=3726 RepID=A0A9W3CW52_RAPSA|nr:EPIDERMAL PATTERNING FACTOR-like protein 8 [Raphanus sativus]KAJ4909037.1 EPIDERMAL PATTERNING FACTOR-like protein 8 [Raphanus sativus]
MVTSLKYKRRGLGAAFLIVNILSSLVSPHSMSVQAGAHDQQLKRKKSVIGSKPPACGNKCLNCKPCLPYLFDIHGAHDDDDDDREPYYPVRWMCRCREKIFGP